MNKASLVLLAVICLLFLLAVRSIIKNRGKGGCSGSCTSCSICTKQCSNRIDKEKEE